MILAEPDPRQILGAWGEEEAEAVLRRGGLTVIERGYRCRLGEIDRIAVSGSLVVFVEVKTRKGRREGRGAEAVTPAKQRRLARIALAFLSGRGWLERPVRFDVVEVRVEQGGATTIRHIPDAFRPGQG